MTQKEFYPLEGQLFKSKNGTTFLVRKTELDFDGNPEVVFLRNLKTKKNTKVEWSEFKEIEKQIKYFVR